MQKPNAHYLRITLVKPLCLPGLKDESLLRKDQIPCETVLAFPDTWHTGFREWKQSYTAFKTFKSDQLRDMNGSCLLCAGSRPREVLPSAPSFPATVSLPGCFSPSMNSCSSFLQEEAQIQPFGKSFPSKQNKPIATHPPQTLVQASAPQYDNIPTTSSSRWAQ